MADPDSFEPDDLKNIPTFRAAYSDRTALLMAKLALRAYDHFDLDDAAWTKFNDELCCQGFTSGKGLIDHDIGTAGLSLKAPKSLSSSFVGPKTISTG